MFGDVVARVVPRNGIDAQATSNARIGHQALPPGAPPVSKPVLFSAQESSADTENDAPLPSCHV